MADENIMFPNDGRMKPIIIVPPETFSDEDLKALRENGLCVVTATDPSKVKFLDPIPSMAGRNKVEDAAIALSRMLLDPSTFQKATGSYLQRGDIAKLFTELLIEGTELDPAIGVHREVFDQTKLDEIRKIAREEAREEAARRKEEKRKKMAERWEGK